MYRGGVIAGERVVGTEAYASLEALECDFEQVAGPLRLAELLIRSAQPRVQLDEDSVPQWMFGADEEVDLAPEVVDCPRVVTRR